MNKNSRIRETSADKIFIIINYVVLTIFFIAVLYPIIYVLSASFSSPKAIISNKIWLLPVDFTLMGYKNVFEYSRVWIGFGNSLYYAGFGTFINIFFTILAAYPLSRKNFRGRTVIMFIFAFTMWFSGGLIPGYLLVKKLHMIDTRWAMIIPGAMSVWNVIITRTYFETQIPNELYESASIDGCDDFTFVGKVVIPLSAPIIAVNALFYAVGHWNSYFSAFLFLSNRNLHPLQLVLREVLLMGQTSAMEQSQLAGMDPEQADQARFLSELLKYSLIVVSSLPAIIAYPFVQKYFVKGMMIGAIKG